MRFISFVKDGTNANHPFPPHRFTSFGGPIMAFFSEFETNDEV
jgi:hypothetical protein